MWVGFHYQIAIGGGDERICGPLSGVRNSGAGLPCRYSIASSTSSIWLTRGVGRRRRTARELGVLLKYKNKKLFYVV